jgi:hypothetical protein
MRALRELAAIAVTAAGLALVGAGLLVVRAAARLDHADGRSSLDSGLATSSSSASR